MTGDRIVGIIFVLACLVLAVRGYRARRVSRQNTLLMAIAWILIIAGLALILGRTGASIRFNLT